MGMTYQIVAIATEVWKIECNFILCRFVCTYHWYDYFIVQFRPISPVV